MTSEQECSDPSSLLFIPVAIIMTTFRRLLKWKNEISRERKMALLISLPVQIISASGWLICAVGLGWTSENFIRPGDLYAKGGSEIFSPPFAFLLGVPLFHVLYSFHVLSDKWLLGVITNLVATLCITFGGYTLCLFYENPSGPIDDPEITLILNMFVVCSAGAGISTFTMGIAMACLPAFRRFCYNQHQSTDPESYSPLTSPRDETNFTNPTSNCAHLEMTDLPDTQPLLSSGTQSALSCTSNNK